MPFNYRPWSLEVQKSTCQDVTKPGTLSTKVMEGVSKDGGIHSEVLRPNQEVGGMLASGRSLKLTAPIDTVGCKPWCVSLNAHVVWVRGIGSDLLSTVKDIDGFGCADGHVAWGQGVNPLEELEQTHPLGECHFPTKKGPRQWAITFCMLQKYFSFHWSQAAPALSGRGTFVLCFM